DLWVRTLKPKNQLASPAERRAVLEATTGKQGEPHFGVPLKATRSAAYLEPGTGTSSLTTIVLPSQSIQFRAAHREGAPGPDFRVTLQTPGLAGRCLPVKDHHLLLRVEAAASNLEGRSEERRVGKGGGD